MEPYYTDSHVTIYHGDCRDVLPSLDPVPSIAVTDPPYNVGRDYGPESSDRLSGGAYRNLLHDTWGAVADIGAVTLLYTPGVVNVWGVPAVVRPPWRLQRLLGWHRKEFAGDNFTWGPAVCWEPVVWASLAEKPRTNRLFGHGGRDFLVVSSVKEDPYRQLHPNPKPEKVFRWLVGIFAMEGDTVVDPFAGVGTALLAAKDAGRRAVGIEIEERYCEIAANRLSQEVLAL